MKKETVAGIILGISLGLSTTMVGAAVMIIMSPPQPVIVVEEPIKLPDEPIEEEFIEDERITRDPNQVIEDVRERFYESDNRPEKSDETPIEDTSEELPVGVPEKIVIEEPAEEPVEEPVEETPETPETPAGGGVSIHKNMTKQDLLNLFGEPDRYGKSQYNFDWYLYNQNSKDFFMYGVDNGYVVALYSFQPIEEIAKGRTHKNQFIGQEDKISRRLFHNHVDVLYKNDIDSFHTNLFFDLDGTLMATEIMHRDYLNSARAHVAHNLHEFSLINFELLNAERSRRGLQPAQWHPLLANIAKDHSVDMVQNAYDGHINLRGEGPLDRVISRAKIPPKTGVAENIAYEYSPIKAHHALMKSVGHRENILLPNMSHVGIGTHTLKELPKIQTAHSTNVFLTQKFFIKVP